MEASLTINTNEGPYIAGSTVSGTVSLQEKSTYSVRSVRLQFSGRCKAKISERGFKHGVHESSLYLFEEEVVLFTGPYTLRLPHSWPFEFQFPHTMNASGIPGHFKSSSPLFDDEMVQPLPPSFTLSSGSLWTNDIDASIRYALEAKLESGTLLSGLQVKKELKFVTLRNVAYPEPELDFQSQILTVQSLYLLPTHENNEPSFRVKAKASVTPRKVPKAQYMLNALMPTVGIVEQKLPLYIGVVFDEDHSTIETQAPVYLEALIVVLVARADVRCPSGSLWTSKDVVDHGEQEIVIGNSNFAFQDIKLTDRLDMASLMDLRITSPRFLGPPIAPTFRSLSVSCQYKLMIHVSTICGNVKRSHKFEGDLRLLAKDYSPQVSSQPTDEIKVVIMGHGDAVDDPPSYDIAELT